MDQALISLIAANMAFVGSHFALSHPLRRGLVKALGERGFLGLYTLVAFATFAWIVAAFLRVGPGGIPLWDGQSATMLVIANLLSVLALTLVFASLKRNPALPGAPAEVVAQEPAGVFTVTRHPFMWGVAIWALSHIVVSPTPRTLVTASAMGVLALLGARLQDRKKAALMGAAWISWEAKTSYWPRWGKLGRIGGGVWLASVIGWLAITWLHVWLASVPAGIWQWLG